MSLVDWASVQARLVKFGFNPGPVDGIRGRMTINAVKRFQEANGLLADGIVGPSTFRALFGETAPGETPGFDRMPWYEEAIRLIGLTEAAGSADNPEILAMAEDLNIDYSGDDIPWCGLFTAHCVGSSLPDEPLPSLPLLARDWEDFGIGTSPQKGAIMTFWRDTRASGKGHVGFYFAETNDKFMILGGNQSDQVNVRAVPKRRFLAARWPMTALSPDGSVVIASGPGIASGSEA